MKLSPRGQGGWGRQALDAENGAAAGMRHLRHNTHQFKKNKEDIVDDKGPFTAVAVGGDSKDDGADRAKH